MRDIFISEACVLVGKFAKEVLEEFEYKPSTQYTYMGIAQKSESWMRKQRELNPLILNTQHGQDNGVVITGILVSVCSNGWINVYPTGPDFDLGYAGQIIWKGSLNEERRTKNEDEEISGSGISYHIAGWGWVQAER